MTDVKRIVLIAGSDGQRPVQEGDRDGANQYRQLLQQDMGGALQVLTAPDDGAALALCQAHPVDAILFETSSSEAGCFSRLRQFRLRLGTPHPPIIAVGDDDTRLAVAAMRAGAVDFWVWPQVSADALAQVLYGAVTEIGESTQIQQERQQILERERAARDVAERANRVKDEFLAILSHELRSPLNPILGWSKLLQLKSLDDAKTQKALVTIERNARLQAQLIDDLLDVARILRGKLKLEEDCVDLVAAVQGAIEVVKTAAEAKSISLQLVPLHRCRVWGDEERLQQIVWNLLSNAIKFTPEGGRVAVRLERRSTYAQITVTDTGQGINRKFIPYLFQSFRQEDVSITRLHGGLGLGLSIVKYLVDAHGGAITAESPGAGRGATFKVRLPLLKDASQPGLDSQMRLPEADLSHIKVLAVDDSQDARELLDTGLTQYGAIARVAASGAEALACLETFEPHVLVCDIGMPDIDGYSLLKQIRALPSERRNIPAIALTALAHEEDRRRALESGFQKHIAKPFLPERLALSVAELAVKPADS